MRRKRKFLLALTLTTSFCAVLLTNPMEVQAQGGRILARSQFRGTVDPSEGPTGNLLLIEENGQQIIRAQINKLELTNLSLQLSPSSYYTTNAPVFYVAPLNRTSKQTGNWSRKLTGNGGPPPELGFTGIENLSDLSNLSSFWAGTPGMTNIVGGTNEETCVQTVTNDIIVVTCTTNIVGGTTNIFINTYVWAPIPPLVANPSIFNFRVKSSLDQPEVAPSPHGSGRIQMTYNGGQGRSLLDVRVNNMIKGQTYYLWVADGGTNWNAGAFEPLGAPGSASAKYRRDTKKGNPLPVQVPSTADLTNRVIQVRDAFGAIHLQGSPPY